MNINLNGFGDMLLDVKSNVLFITSIYWNNATLQLQIDAKSLWLSLHYSEIYNTFACLW